MTSQPFLRAHMVMKFNTWLFPVPFRPSSRKPALRMRGTPLASAASCSCESCMISSTVGFRSIRPTGRVCDGTSVRSFARSPHGPSGRSSMRSSRSSLTKRPTSLRLTAPRPACQRCGRFTGVATSSGATSADGGHWAATSSEVTASSLIACCGPSSFARAGSGTSGRLFLGCRRSKRDRRRFWCGREMPAARRSWSEVGATAAAYLLFGHVADLLGEKTFWHGGRTRQRTKHIAD
mmetsp:Transcript_78868/g.255482  ORF Transcript_78868/g.255482 Transcript_78868/m.255482 type:complete len:236 (-) Transcript_78868:13-720(-)